MDTPSTFHMKESYVIKTQSHDLDTPTYMEALSGENPEEYFKAMDDEIQSLMRRDPHCSSQNISLTNHFTTFYTIGVRLRIDHIGFSFT